MFFLKNSTKNQIGETQLSIVLVALFIGLASWVIFTLEGCIREHKDSKVRKNYEADRKKIESRRKVDRGVGGYTVRTK